MCIYKLFMFYMIIQIIDSILKSRDITLPTKVRLVKCMVFPVVSPTRCTWVWVISGRWWRTGRPGVLRFMGSQSWTLLSDWTELKWTTPVLELTWLPCSVLSCLVLSLTWKASLIHHSCRSIVSQRKPSYVIEGKCKHRPGRITCGQLMLWEQVYTIVLMRPVSLL